MSELRTNRIVPRDGLPSGSAGGIIQVKSVTYTTQDSITNENSFVSKGPSATITPTRSDSKILIQFSVNGQNRTNGLHVLGRLVKTIGGSFGLMTLLFLTYKLLFFLSVILLGSLSFIYFY